MKVIICTLKTISSMGNQYPTCGKRVQPRDNQPFTLCRSNASTCSYLKSFNVEDPKESEQNSSQDIPLDNIITMQTL